jgi:hypothetical protein
MWIEVECHLFNFSSMLQQKDLVEPFESKYITSVISEGLITVIAK